LNTIKNIKEFSAIFNNINQLIYIGDRDTFEILYANQAFKDVYGEDVIGKKCYQIIRDFTNPCDFCTNNIIFNQKSSYNWDNFNTKTQKHYLFSDKAIDWPDGRKVRFQFAIDITELKKAELNIRKLSCAVEQSPATIIITDVSGKIEYANQKFVDLTGYSKEEVIGKKPNIFKSGAHSLKFYQSLWKTIISGKSWKGEFQNIKKNGKKYWEKAIIAPIIDEKNNITHFVAIKEDITVRKFAKEQLKKKNRELELKNINIKSSLNYSRLIQKAVLPPSKFLDVFFKENFILYMPKDIVSGDFYWIKQTKNQLFIAAADCTGHGVPGALMSMLSITLLNEIYNKIIDEENIKANEILNQLRESIKLSFKIEGNENSFNDGLDIALCVIDKGNYTMNYSGAHHPLFLVRKNKDKYGLNYFSPDRMPISTYLVEKPFTCTEIDLKKDDIIYIFTDGFIDQFGGNEEKKFQSKNFKELILEICTNSLAEQKNLLTEKFYDWKGNREQIDDILIIGFKID
jgi:PAS domain S-box-containing protein